MGEGEEQLGMGTKRDLRQLGEKRRVARGENKLGTGRRKRVGSTAKRNVGRMRNGTRDGGEERHGK